MSTFNGLGTMYYGWRHAGDGTAIATKWFVVLWIPVLPLARHHLRLLTDLSLTEPFLQTERQGFFAGTPVQVTGYQVISTERPRATEVLATYFWTFAVLPPLLSWPLWAVLAGGAFLDKHPALRENNAILAPFFVLTILIMVNPIVVVLIALRKARGAKGGLWKR